MDFVGDGGSNIAIKTTLHPIIFGVFCCKHQTAYGISLSYFPCMPENSVSDMETNPAMGHPVPAVCRTL